MPFDDVSVIIPTYNRARYLPATLASVCSQTYPGRIEVIVIDDGSTDDTPAAVAPFLTPGMSGRVSVHYHRRGKAGVCSARTAGLTLSRCPLVAFLDSDDVWEPEKLEHQAAQLSTDVRLTHTDFRYINTAGAFIDTQGQRPNNPAREACLPQLLREDTVVFSSVLADREVIDRAAAAEPHGLPFDPVWTNGQDYDLLLRCARLTRFGFVPRPLTRYRVHPDQNAMGNLPRVYGFHCRVQMSFCDRWGAACGLPAEAGRDAAREFLFSRTESMYWQRKLGSIRPLCDLADQLGLADERFARLRRLARRPRWLLRLRDVVDRIR
ncbi:glycosyltransferase family 2 protein [Limnoglobus roseus]|uniref:GT2 family glycosyltransferase n=1 Tax=Limnoglobus roseus TaxID=2598579 RepID=A0A5C1AAH1_9BACT|nr:glycosyltransferase family 2 protein [Limnoglobus roseus]QEL15565.1 GT2 family glycosyltransferase [Limnoglobus roseus]